jgi:hypothetical protein
MSSQDIAAIDVESVVSHIERLTGMPFRREADGSYVSPSGLRYSLDANTGEHRIIHALRHGAPAAPGKPVHTIFRDQISMLADVDHAWAFRGNPDLGNPKRYTVRLGPVGTLSETSVVIVIKAEDVTDIRTTFLEP